MNFTKGKRGLSDVITTVLIILLVLAAVVLIWGFIRKPIEQGGQQIELSSACLRLADVIVPTTCSVNVAAKTASMTMRRTSGDDITLVGVKAVLTGDAGANLINDSTTYPGVLESRTYTFALGGTTLDGNNAYSASVAGVVSAAGKTGTCQESLTKISCTKN